MNKHHSVYHVSQWTGVDVGVMNAAVFSISVFPVGRTVVMFAELPSCVSIHYGTKHTNSPDQFRPGQKSVWSRVECVHPI